jgi:ribonuclease P protein component
MPALLTLRHKTDFDAVGRHGLSRASGPLVLRALRTDGTASRVGLSTPRALGGAVQRNRVRRRLRALLRERADDLGVGWDLLLIARPGAAQASHAELREALANVLRVTTRRLENG